jgi:hypothetical protein
VARLAEAVRWPTLFSRDDAWLHAVQFQAWHARLQRQFRRWRLGDLSGLVRSGLRADQVRFANTQQSPGSGLSSVWQASQV